MATLWGHVMNQSNSFMCQILRWQDSLMEYQLQGTGILISPNCILTCKHSVSISTLLLPVNMLVVHFQGQAIPAKVSLIKVSKDEDMALVYLEKSRCYRDSIPLLDNDSTHEKVESQACLSLGYENISKQLVVNNQTVDTSYNHLLRLRDFLPNGVTIAPLLKNICYKGESILTLLGVASNPNDQQLAKDIKVISTNSIQKFLQENHVTPKIVHKQDTSTEPPIEKPFSFLQQSLRFAAGFVLMITAGMVMATLL